MYLDGSHGTVASESAPSAVSPESSTRSNPSRHFGLHNRTQSVFSVLCQHLPATCPLDRILLDFLSSRRAMAAIGTPTRILLGPERPLMTAILFPEMATTAHPVSRVMAEVLNTFPHVKLPEKLSFMYLMHGTMRVFLPYHLQHGNFLTGESSGKYHQAKKITIAYLSGSDPQQLRSRPHTQRGSITFPGRQAPVADEC